MRPVLRTELASSATVHSAKSEGTCLTNVANNHDVLRPRCRMTKGLCMHVSLKDLSSMAKEKKTIVMHEKLVVKNKHFDITSYSIFQDRSLRDALLLTSKECRISTRILKTSWLHTCQTSSSNRICKWNLNCKENTWSSVNISFES